MEAGLLREFDRLCRRRKYATRSEALRDLVRKELIAAEWAEEESQVAGTITLVYDHRLGDLAERLTEMQHRYHRSVQSALHIHLDARHCLEVVVVTAKAKEARALADALTSARGVKHGQLVCTTLGGGLG